MIRDVFLPISAQPSIDRHVEYTRQAEEKGYDRVWIAETWGRDAVTTLATIAAHTEDIGIGTSISSIYSRSPGLLGQTAATLQEVSGGRFRLGLGPSTPQLVEGWHGIAHKEPFRRLRETVEITRLVLTGEVVDYDGAVFDVSGFRLRFEPPSPPPAIDVAAMGPKSMELAGRFADGCHTPMVTPRGLTDRLADLKRGAELGGRDPDEVRVTVDLPCCVLNDGDRARELLRHHVAFYVGGMGRVYYDSLVRQGYETEAAEIARQWADQEQDAAMAAVSDELLDGLGVAGSPAEARDLWQQWERIEGIDAVAVLFPVRAGKAEISETIDALAPSA